MLSPVESRSCRKDFAGICVSFFKVERAKNHGTSNCFAAHGTLEPDRGDGWAIGDAPCTNASAAGEPAFEVSVVRVSKPDVQNSNLNLGEDRLQAQN